MPAVAKRDRMTALRADVFRMVFLRGFSQADAARKHGLTTGRIAQIVGEGISEWRANRIKTPHEDVLDQKREQLAEVRSEAWDAWERSKLDEECTREERALRTQYREDEQTGKMVEAGAKLVLVKKIDSARGRLPANEYLQTVRQCLKDEAELDGLLVDPSPRTNVQVNVGINFESLLGRDAAMPSDLERRIVEAEVNGAPRLNGSNR